MCSAAGIDGERLRYHLRLCERLAAEGMDELLEERGKRGGLNAAHIPTMDTLSYYNNFS